MRLIACVVVALCWSVAAADRAAEEPAAADWTRAYNLSAQLMSPFCPGLTLAACPSSQAVELRADIAERLSRGETPDAIVDSLVARFGEGIRATPPGRGAGLTMWVLPPVFAAVLLGAAWLAARRHGGRRPPAPPPLDPDDARRLDEELERLA